MNLSYQEKKQFVNPFTSYSNSCDTGEFRWFFLNTLYMNSLALTIDKYPYEQKCHIRAQCGGTQKLTLAHGG